MDYLPHDSNSSEVKGEVLLLNTMFIKSIATKLFY